MLIELLKMQTWMPLCVSSQTMIFIIAVISILLEVIVKAPQRAVKAHLLQHRTATNMGLQQSVVCGDQSTNGLVPHAMMVVW